MTHLKSSEHEVSISKTINVGYVFDLPLNEVYGGDFYAFDGLNANEDEKESIGFG